jgi:antitoxin MazE
MTYLLCRYNQEMRHGNSRAEVGGNSLASRIPQPLADEVGLRKISPVELWLRDNTLVIVPVAKPTLDLTQLLAQVTADNLHREIEAGPAVGGEAW